MAELQFPQDLSYSAEHEWIAHSDGTWTMGITDYAQDQLGDLVFVELPEAGDTFAKGDVFGSVESVKSVSELYCPVDCEVVEVNPALEDDPNLVNTDPYGKGWMIKVTPANVGDKEILLSREDYLTGVGLA